MDSPFLAYILQWLLQADVVDVANLA